ncbi:hypothetical protein SmJEL517_g02090 [Synchytrium microbalum]|uniref:Uncharacterized protein n=1 Tax=Synchytrium microbalum TaxID=1806994 RepID=A0A507C8L8_9FUNG|nr:uncharacterized protein SmJEL517_g02090 [Synchytrium microbalum]TPX35489.1 hypothetical protein SmJEL517_g02090 [Synchytrium microbalum]
MKAGQQAYPHIDQMQIPTKPIPIASQEPIQNFPSSQTPDDDICGALSSQQQIQSYQLGNDNGKGLTPSAVGTSYAWGTLTFGMGRLLEAAEFAGSKISGVLGITEPKYAMYHEDAHIQAKEAS